MNYAELKELREISKRMEDLLAGDPYAELKKAQDAGEVIQVLVGGEWNDVSFKCAFTNPSELYRVKPEPELYSGLTFEQWVIVKDGGFLCGFKDGDREKPSAGKLDEVYETSHFSFEHESGEKFIDCRPMRTAGIIQPVLDSEEFREYMDSLGDDCSVVMVAFKGLYDVSIVTGRHFKANYEKVSSFIVLP